MSVPFLPWYSSSANLSLLPTFKKNFVSARPLTVKARYLRGKPHSKMVKVMLGAHMTRL